MCVCVSVQLCPNLCNQMGSSLPGSSVHGIFQERILEWVAISFSRGSSQPRNQTHVSWCVSRSPALAGRSFTSAPPGKPMICEYINTNSGFYKVGKSRPHRKSPVLMLLSIFTKIYNPILILL